MLFDAHIHAFRVLGGVPRRGIYDNMKTAVDRVVALPHFAWIVTEVDWWLVRSVRFPIAWTMTDFFPMPGCRVEQVTPEVADFLTIAAHGTGPGNRCPDCGWASRAVHSRYRRKLADLPSLGRRVGVSLRVRRFYCRNAKCARRTFAERLPGLVAPYARRTYRLATAQAQVGVALGGEAGSRLLQHLAMPVSPDTVLRLVHRLPLPAPDPPRVVGVDDWAIRKRCSYGTVVVDLERHRVLDLLPDRTAETLAEWLRDHPGIEAVARDRSTEYARGITLGAPKAIQTADRWHLLANMRQAVERWLHGAQARLRRLPMPPDGDKPAVPARRDQAFPRSAPERAAGAESRARWQAHHAEVRRRRLAGETLLGIAHATGLALGTVRKYARAETFPARAPYGPGLSILDPYLSHLQRRLGEGCENGLALWRELRGQGFSGSTRQVHRWLIERRTVPAKTEPHVRRTRKEGEVRPPAAHSTAPALPTVPQLAWLLVQPAAALDAADAATATRVEQDSEAAAVVGLARRFTALVRDCGVASRQDNRTPADPAASLDAWLTDARACSASAIAMFATGLEADGAAVRAALTQPWSSGQAEGQINRLKLLKRQSYGRASFDLLRRRVLMAA
jgi:transposase